MFMLCFCYMKFCGMVELIVAIVTFLLVFCFHFGTLRSCNYLAFVIGNYVTYCMNIYYIDTFYSQTVIAFYNYSTRLLIKNANIFSTKMFTKILLKILMHFLNYNFNSNINFNKFLDKFGNKGLCTKENMINLMTWFLIFLLFRQIFEATSMKFSFLYFYSTSLYLYFFKVYLQLQFLKNTTFLQKLFSLGCLIFYHGS